MPLPGREAPVVARVHVAQPRARRGTRTEVGSKDAPASPEITLARPARANTAIETGQIARLSAADALPAREIEVTSSPLANHARVPASPGAAPDTDTPSAHTPVAR